MNKSIKNITISDENIINLLLIMDQFAMINKSIEKSLDEIIEEYKEEYTNDTNYDNYYEFLSDKIEEMGEDVKC